MFPDWWAGVETEVNSVVELVSNLRRRRVRTEEVRNVLDKGLYEVLVDVSLERVFQIKGNLCFGNEVSRRSY